MHPQFLHLSGERRGDIETIPHPVVVIGSAKNADLIIAGSQPLHAVVEYHQEECCFYLRSRDGVVFVNGHQIEEVILEHGDLLEIGAGGPKLRFRVHSELGETCKPVRKMLADAKDSREIHGWTGFLGSLMRDVHHRTSLLVKILVPIAVAVLAFIAAYWGGWLGGRDSRTRLAAQEAELAVVRNQLQKFKDEQALLVSKVEIDKLRTDFASRASVIDRLAANDAALKRVLDLLSKAVGLIHGEFRFLRDDPSGTPVELTDSQGNPMRAEYVGSGFVAKAGGWVITNRHVAQPWWNNDQFQAMISLGFRPEFVRFDFILPGRPRSAVDPKSIRVRSDEMDVAVFQAEVGDAPIIPSFTGELSSLRGEHVVVLGYPTGVNALLAKAPSDIASRAAARGQHLSDVLEVLATNGAILPLATQGGLNEVLPHQLVYDASTTSGGSGGPVFGPDGTVIGVNYAILQQFGGSNFGVPIRFALELLP